MPEEMFLQGFRVTAADRSDAAVKRCDAKAASAEAARALAGTHPLGRVACVVEDAIRLSFGADRFDAVVEVGLLDTLAAAGENGALQTAIREMHRVVRGGSVLVSVSTEPPLYRMPLLEETPKGGWSVAVSRLPRPRRMDHRVAALNPDLDVDSLAVYHATKLLDGAPSSMQPKLPQYRPADLSVPRPLTEGAAASEAASQDASGAADATVATGLAEATGATGAADGAGNAGAAGTSDATDAADAAVGVDDDVDPAAAPPPPPPFPGADTVAAETPPESSAVGAAGLAAAAAFDAEALEATAPPPPPPFPGA